MKSEFMLAFNQICNERNLPREVVLQALQTALVSAYRRSVNASTAQNIVAEIDATTGNALIFVEKEVVEEVQDERTEVSLDEARRSVPDASLSDMVMVDSTPQDFGRVAAQMAKQVILQRIREAERDALYANFSEREGEIINGTVQSITSQAVTLNLGRTEASLPKSQQVPGERYTVHQRLRAYVMEVRKSPRGPQIVVSRSHKNMLRRLLELEVPEIYNGIVEIKSIAREAGARSKVAVVALQPGVDPVGSCVGMKGVRIQSIVSELNGEKIDVIEWSSDAPLYISKALSPARVLVVYADDDPLHGKTALVVVPDDQLSLAIGREGQNARLAAKLTNWRIDIKSASEAALELVGRLQDAERLAELGPGSELLHTLQAVLARHDELQLPWNGDELDLLRQLLDAQHAAELARKAAERAQRAKSGEPAGRPAQGAKVENLLACIPPAAQDAGLDQIGLSERVLNHLARGKLASVADVLQRLAIGDEAMLSIEGIGPKALAEIKAQIEAKGLWFTSPVAEEAEALAAVPEVVEAEALAGVPEAVEAEVPQVSAEIEEAEEQVPVAPEQQVPVLAQPAAGEPLETRAAEPALETAGLVVTPEATEIDYEDEDEDEPDKAKKKGKGKQRKLVLDERTGAVVAHRQRKPSRRRDVWEEEE